MKYKCNIRSIYRMAILFYSIIIRVGKKWYEKKGATGHKSDLNNCDTII